MKIIGSEIREHGVTLHLENGTTVLISSNIDYLHISLSFADQLQCEQTASNECSIYYKTKPAS